MSTTQNKKNGGAVIIAKDLRTETDKQQEDQKHTIKKDISNKSSHNFSGQS
ncbi:MAG: hypothetical protein ACJARD_001503 [Alphaproteobacteria bacterium]|jgi:hypothetical protein